MADVHLMLQTFYEDYNRNSKKSAHQIIKHYANKMPFSYHSCCYCSCYFINMRVLIRSIVKWAFALGLCRTICLDLEGGGSGPGVVSTD